MEQEGPDLGFAELLGRAHVEGGKLAAIQQIVADGGGAEGLELEVLLHPIAQLSHGGISLVKRNRYQGVQGNVAPTARSKRADILQQAAASASFNGRARAQIMPHFPWVFGGFF